MTPPWGVVADQGAGMALVVLSVVEQRLDAVRAVLPGRVWSRGRRPVGVARSTLHRWVGRYLEGRWPGWRIGRIGRCRVRIRSTPAWRRRSRRCVAGIRGGVRNGSGWSCCGGCRRPGRSAVEPPSDRTVDRILMRQGLVEPRPRKRPRASYRAVRAAGADAVVGDRHRRRDLAGRPERQVSCGRRRW